MANCFDKLSFSFTVKTIMQEEYPHEEYKRMKQGVLKESVKKRISDYIANRYGDCDKEEFKEILQIYKMYLPQVLKEIGMEE